MTDPTTPRSAQTASQTGQGSDGDALLAADDQRYAALLAADLPVLTASLDEDFIHIHSSGREEPKDSFVESIRSGRVVYHHVDLQERSSWIQNGVGVVRGHVVLDLHINNAPRRLDLVFLAVWRRVENRWVLRYWASVPWQTSQPPAGAAT